MTSKTTLKLSPNGNGALFESLKLNKPLQKKLAAHEYVQVIGVDNVINKVLDPI